MLWFSMRAILRHVVVWISDSLSVANEGSQCGALGGALGLVSAVERPSAGS